MAMVVGGEGDTLVGDCITVQSDVMRARKGYV